MMGKLNGAINQYFIKYINLNDTCLRPQMWCRIGVCEIGQSLNSLRTNYDFKRSKAVSFQMIQQNIFVDIILAKIN